VKTVLLLVLLVLGGGWGGITRIRDRNEAVKQAAAAYTRQDFAAAAQAYQKAVEELGAADEETVLNLAHACARAGQNGAAKAYYGRLLSSESSALRSIAQQQLGVLAVQKGEFAQAIGLLRLALLADPTNAEARYNYEVLRDYLARRPDSPQIPPPAPAGKADSERAAPKPQQKTEQEQTRAGNDRAGQLDEPNLPSDSKNAPQPRPNESGQRNANQPSTAPGNTARGGFRPGDGAERSMSTGAEPGGVRGLSNTAEAGAELAEGRSRRAGTEAAAFNEAQLQTQRARLQQMQLSPGRARQILESLGAAEQQYLQQLPRRATRKPARDKPAW
jgi:tetratricopeptide (TPR) repeat protein